MTLHCSITYDAFIFIAESCICRNLGITVYKDSNTLATIQHWCILFLPGRSGQKSNVWCMLQVALPTHPINQCEPVQQSRQQVLRAYCPNIYIVLHAYIHTLHYVRQYSHKLQRCVYIGEFHQGNRKIQCSTLWV